MSTNLNLNLLQIGRTAINCDSQRPLTRALDQDNALDPVFNFTQQLLKTYEKLKNNLRNHARILDFFKGGGCSPARRPENSLDNFFF